MREPDHTAETLLIVDDEANIHGALGRLFRRDGYRVLSAETGNAALDLLALQEVGVILSDLRMPDMSGVQFLSTARERWPDTVRIVLSGFTELGSVTDTVNQAAIYQFLTKPWDAAALREAVRKAFQLHRVSRENTRLATALRQANDSLLRWNQELELRVEEKTREAMRNLNILAASQEILAHLPLPVVGIDPDGCLVMANRAAECKLGISPALLGEWASEVLPAEMLDGPLDADGGGQVMLADGRLARYWRYPLGTAAAAIGTALVIHHLDPQDAHEPSDTH